MMHYWLVGLVYCYHEMFSFMHEAVSIVYQKKIVNILYHHTSGLLSTMVCIQGDVIQDDPHRHDMFLEDDDLVQRC